jgi:hypothetical protein
MPELEKIIDKLASNQSAVHPNFRLWLSSSPHPKFPIAILQRSIKITTEPPRGIRANIIRLYNLLDEGEFSARCAAAPSTYAKLMYSLSWYHSLLLERRIGEFALPRGTWVVAAGNRIQDRALVRAMSSALLNRVTVLHVRVDVDEWLQWAATHGVRPEIRRFVASMPESLVRPVPEDPMPFSTPRAWAALSRSLDLAQSANVLDAGTRRALAFGRLSPEDAAMFCALAEESLTPLRELGDYLREPHTLPQGESGRWFVLDCIRQHVKEGRLEAVDAQVVDRFLLRQANTVISNADRARGLVDIDRDPQLAIIFEQRSVVDRLEAQLV